jgi:hypothetical protein
MRVIRHKKAHRGGVTIEPLIERGIMICGSPDTVRRRITEAHNLMGFQEFIAMLQFAALPVSRKRTFGFLHLRGCLRSRP